MIETAGLVLALFVIGGFIAYWVWPPSAEYLYKQAETLMASTSRGDWRTALDEYINPLDERFPDHPYREQTRAWRDKIMLEEVEGRASILASKVKTSFSEPKDNRERSFVIANALAADASERGDDLAAIRQWQEFAAAGQSRRSGRAEMASAGAQAGQVARKRDQRSAASMSRSSFSSPMDAFRAGRTNEGETIKNKLRGTVRQVHRPGRPVPAAAASDGRSEDQAAPAGRGGTSPEPPADSPTETPTAAAEPRGPIKARPIARPKAADPATESSPAASPSELPRHASRQEPSRLAA